jgi:hypothetical protein
MDDGKTWHWDSGWLVGWNYRPMARSDGRLVPLDLEDPATRRHWLSELVGRLPILLGDFAHVTEVKARGKGNSACMIDWRNNEGPPTLLGFLRQAEIWVVDAHLDLTCVDRDLEPLKITNGAHFLIKVVLTESGALDTASDAPVYIRLELNADIYAPWSFGDVQDNALLARLNGPRLAGILERIESDVPAQLLDMDGESYGGLVGPRGFTAPPNAFRDV